VTHIAEAIATELSGGTELSRSLRSRHVSMIAIGGIIGAGLFVGSSTAIKTAGPAAIAAMAAIMVCMGLTPDLASQLWMSLLVAGGFAVAFVLRRGIPAA